MPGKATKKGLRSDVSGGPLGGSLPGSCTDLRQEPGPSTAQEDSHVKSTLGQVGPPREEQTE